MPESLKVQLIGLVFNRTWNKRARDKPKFSQSWEFIGRTDAEAETPILWPPDEKNRLIGKDPDAGKDLRREKCTTG